MLPKKICIITQSHLCRNPRVLKEALALSSAGYLITIINSTYNNELHNEDVGLIKNTGIELIAVAALETGGFASLTYRLAKKVGDMLVKKVGLQTPLALGYASWVYKSIALKQNADLYIGHQELGLYCGVELLKAGKKVAFDLEDWYSEDLLDDARSCRPIELLRELEETALKRGVFCTVPSTAMGECLAKTYNSDVPATIYNTFDFDNHLVCRSKTFNNPLKLFWFSQTIGPGRGLEQFFEIVNQLQTKLEIHLLGNVNEAYKNQLTSLLQSPHLILFHPLVPAQQLAAKIAEFDIGLALELKQPTSRNVTITNKFFQYVLSGLPAIVTPTDGQITIFNEYAPGFLLDDENSPYLTKRLDDWLQNKQLLQNAKDNAIKFAAAYSWQNESLKLIKLVNNVNM